MLASKTDTQSNSNGPNSSKKIEWPKLTSDIVHGFAASCLTKFMDDASQFAEFHLEWWELCCSDDKFVAVCAPRGHSKSTTITIVYTLACVLFRNRKYGIIVADTETLINWFNDVFSFYRLKLKIETYREIKFVERNNEEFVSQVETFDEIIRGTSDENESSSDKHYFLLNKISGILNAFGYEQQILHAITDIQDFGQSDDESGYFVQLV